MEWRPSWSFLLEHSPTQMCGLFKGKSLRKLQMNVWRRLNVWTKTVTFPDGITLVLLGAALVLQLELANHVYDVIWVHSDCWVAVQSEWLLSSAAVQPNAFLGFSLDLFGFFVRQNVTLQSSESAIIFRMRGFTIRQLGWMFSRLSRPSVCVRKRFELRVSHGGAAWSPVALPQQGALFLASEQQEGEKEATRFYLARTCRDDDTRAAEREAGEGRVDTAGWGRREVT